MDRSRDTSLRCFCGFHIVDSGALDKCASCEGGEKWVENGKI